MKDFLFKNRIKLYAWLSLISQILIVVTGGLVRLTGSGLGCPTWPECKPGSLVTVPELGYHGVIEFANRLLTFVLLIISILTFVTVLLMPNTSRRGFFWTSYALGLGIVAQAVIGGITVLTGLNSWIVGSHFIVSAILIGIATALLWYSKNQPLQEIPKLGKFITSMIFPFGLLALTLGVIVTGAGPHAGDRNTPRNGLDIDLFVHFHSYPAYITLGLVVFQIILLIRNGLTASSSIFLFGALLFQAGVGIAQTRLGLPIELVAVHLLGASVICSLITWQMLTRGIWFKKR